MITIIINLLSNKACRRDTNTQQLSFMKPSRLCIFIKLQRQHIWGRKNNRKGNGMGTFHTHSRTAVILKSHSNNNNVFVYFHLEFRVLVRIFVHKGFIFSRTYGNKGRKEGMKTK